MEPGQNWWVGETHRATLWSRLWICGDVGCCAEQTCGVIGRADPAKSLEVGLESSRGGQLVQGHWV